MYSCILSTLQRDSCPVSKSKAYGHLQDVRNLRWFGESNPSIKVLVLGQLYYNGFTMVSAILGVSFLSPCRRENSIFARNTSSKMFSINPCSSTSRRPRNRDKSRQSESEGLFQIFGQLNQAKFVCF